MNTLIDKIKNLKDIFEPLDFCVFIKDPVGRIVYMNPAFVKFTGYSFSQMIYETTEAFLDGNTIQISESLKDDHSILSGDKFQTNRIMFLRNAHGTDMVMRVLKTPMRFKNNIIGILGCAENVTENYRMHYISIERAVRNLSPNEKMIVFQYSRGLSRKEVAKSLNLHPSTADTTWQRAREKLQLAGDDLKLFLRFYNDLIDNTYTN